MTHPTLIELAARLAGGETTSRALIEESLACISDPQGEGARAFLTVYAERARAEADAIDAARAKGAALPRFAGVPLSIKDLFDVDGEPTRAGSRALIDAPVAVCDAEAVKLARLAGFVIVGKTNMTEFAYGAFGVNPHCGTPLSPWDRERGHVPGGSTSGGAVSVADGMAPATLGTDTGGSCRIPAAFCGIVGFKPTQRRVSLKGVFPLAPSLDSVGPLAMTVSCCAALDSVLSGGSGEDEPSAALARLSIVACRLRGLRGPPGAPRGPRNTVRSLGVRQVGGGQAHEPGRSCRAPQPSRPHSQGGRCAHDRLRRARSADGRDRPADAVRLGRRCGVARDPRADHPEHRNRQFPRPAGDLNPLPRAKPRAGRLHDDGRDRP